MPLSKAATDAYIAKYGLKEVAAEDLEAPVGKYDTTYEAAKQGGSIQRRLPETITSALMLVMLSARFNANTIITRIGPVFLGVVISTVLQTGLAGFMYKAIVGTESGALLPTCGATTPLLLHMALFLFTCFPVKDFVETFGMLQWLNEIPTTEEHERLEVQLFKDGPFMLLRPVTGMPLGERAFYCLACLVSKLLVAIVCLLAGSGAILRAANDYDLVMATVAATFIMEADDMLYNFLVADFLKGRVSSSPAFGVPDSMIIPTAEGFWINYQGYILPLIALLVGNVLLRCFWCAGAGASIAWLLIVLGVVGAAALAGVSVLLYRFQIPAGEAASLSQLELMV